MEKVIQFLDELDAALFSLRLILAGYRGLVLVPLLSIVLVTGLYQLSGWAGPCLALLGLCAYRALRTHNPAPRGNGRRTVVQETSSA